MKKKPVKVLPEEVALLKKLRDKALVEEEKKKRKQWIQKLMAADEAVRDVPVSTEVLDPKEVFQKIAERLVEEGF